VLTDGVYFPCAEQHYVATSKNLVRIKEGVKITEFTETLKLAKDILNFWSV
jgi:hypothetical protein